MGSIKISNFNLNNDIDIAKLIIDGKIDNNFNKFYQFSPIYKITNEKISHKSYTRVLKNKNRVLSIIGSGDQVINSILFGSKNIIGVDISIFPKYFLVLKFAAIKVLLKDDYLEYFYGIIDNPFLDKYYDKIRLELDDATRLFWDSLYNKYSDDLYDSSLFNGFKLDYKRAIDSNPFLKDSYFDILKEKIKKIDVELFEYDMFKAYSLNRGYFDLIILSNIIDNMDYSNNCMCYQNTNILFNKYKTFLENLPLNRKGIALTYNFCFNGNMKDFFNGREYQIYKVREEFKTFFLENEIMIYKKIKHK